MKMRRLISSLVLFGCCAAVLAQQNAPSNLAGTSWRLVMFQSSDDTTLVPSATSSYTLAFNLGGSVNVQADCNHGRGTWTSPSPGQIEFGPVALTRMMCPPSPLNRRFARDLENISSYIIKDGHLFLALKIDGGIYEFEPLKAEQQSDDAVLEDTGWKLVRLGTHEVPAAPPGFEPHIVLDSHTKRISGFGGCNRITGTYRLEADKLTFIGMAATMMACVKGMETEDAFLKALNQVQHWKISGQQMELHDANGNLIAVFKVYSEPMGPLEK